jgi:hypothetical protein
VVGTLTLSVPLLSPRFPPVAEFDLRAVVIHLRDTLVELGDTRAGEITDSIGLSAGTGTCEADILAVHINDQLSSGQIED